MNNKSALIQERLNQLKANGSTPINAIKAIHTEFDLSLADAKREFSFSRAWHQEVESAERLHADLIIFFEKGPKT